MSTSHLVDPELRTFLDYIPAFDPARQSLVDLREQIRTGLDLAPAPEDLTGVKVEEIVISGGDGQEMAVLVYRGSGDGAVRPAILHIHGGGYVMCSARTSDHANRRLAMESGCTVVAVDYRLAPETPHPGPVEDCYAALRWLHAEAGALAIDPDRIALHGESAGGGLAAAVALIARDRDGPVIRHQHLIYPMLDDRTGAGAEPNPNAGEFVWTAAANRFGWQALLGHAPGGDDTPPYAAAARAADLGRLPPTFIATAALDLFVDEDLDYARRLIRRGVPTELHVYPGAYHGFTMCADATVTRNLQRDSLAALRKALLPQS